MPDADKKAAFTITDETRIIRSCCHALDKAPEHIQGRILSYINDRYRYVQPPLAGFPSGPMVTQMPVLSVVPEQDGRDVPVDSPHAD
jgi:hypothetical protein